MWIDYGSPARGAAAHGSAARLTRDPKGSSQGQSRAETTMRRGSDLITIALLPAVAFVAANVAAGPVENSSTVTIERKTCKSPDGVTIAYSAAGAGATALVFVHGGLADRTFYDGQLQAFAGSTALSPSTWPGTANPARTAGDGGFRSSAPMSRLSSTLRN